MMKPQIGELVFFWILFGTVGALAFFIMSPYLTPLFLAGVFTILFSPIHRRMLKWTKGNGSLSAFLTVLVVLCLILVPLIFIGVLMFQEVVTIYGSLTEGNAAFAVVDTVTKTFEGYIQKLIPAFKMNANLYVYLETALRWVAANLNTFFSSILEFTFQIFIIIIAMFFFYRDGARLHAFALEWSPLADNYDESIIAKIQLAVSSVVKGALTTAIVQGALVGVGFMFFGIPNPVIWGTISTIAALIPVVGTGIITVPMSIWLLVTGHIGSGIGLLLWGVLFVGLVDNILRPYMMKKGIDVHPFLILLSVFGGLAYFGPVGFLAGPIVLAFFFALLEIYPQVVKGRPIKRIAGEGHGD